MDQKQPEGWDSSIMLLQERRDTNDSKCWLEITDIPLPIPVETWKSGV